MSKIIFNEHQRRLLETNQNVASVSDCAIQYTAEFKIKAVKENQLGKGPAQTLHLLPALEWRLVYTQQRSTFHPPVT